MRTVRCAIAGFGFIGPHHAEAMRRLGFVEVHGIFDAGLDVARAKAAEHSIPRVYESWQALIADPEVDVVDIAVPTDLHHSFAMQAISAGKHVIVEKPLALSSRQAAEMLNAAEKAGVTHAVTFNYRYNPMVQQARALIAAGELGEIHLVHGQYLQEWLVHDTDYNWRVEPERSGESAMMADAGCHWFDLTEHITGLRVEAVLADYSTTIQTRKRPLGGSREAFAKAGAGASEDYAVKVPDRGMVLLRFNNGARGVFFTSALCPGHKNDLRIEVNGLGGTLAWHQEKPNRLWIGKRDEADRLLTRDPGLLSPEARRYAATPGGHNEAWPDAFRNLMRNIFERIAGRRAEIEFPTFADGLRAARIAEAMLASSRAGGRWTEVEPRAVSADAQNS
jgi:predicted dehydrogenase